MHIFERSTALRLLQAKAIHGLGQIEGVRLYRRGFRVYPYGMPGNHWLTRNFQDERLLSDRALTGTVYLQGEEDGLEEGLARNGFRESESAYQLESILSEALLWFWSQYKEDEDKPHQLESSRRTGGDDFARTTETLRYALSDAGLSSYYDALLHSMADERQTLIDIIGESTYAANRAVAFHEMEKAVGSMLYQVRRNSPEDGDLLNMVNDIDDMLLTTRAIARDLKNHSHSTNDILGHVYSTNKMRFRRNGIEFVCPPLTSNENGGFQVEGRLTNILGVLELLVENAVYWLKVRAEEFGCPVESEYHPRLYIGTSRTYGHRSIVIADNGPGFEDSPDLLIRPQFTRRPDRPGNGLYLANLTMGLLNGSLLFPEPGELDIPAGIDGAIVALAFPEDHTEHQE